MVERPSTPVIFSISLAVSTMSSTERPLATIVFVTIPIVFHGPGGLDKLVALWSSSSEALQSPQLVDPEWLGSSITKEIVTFGNIGEPGRTYQVGTGNRGVTPSSGRIQTVRSDVTLKS